MYLYSLICWFNWSVQVLGRQEDLVNYWNSSPAWLRKVIAWTQWLAPVLAFRDTVDAHLHTSLLHLYESISEAHTFDCNLF